MQLHLYKNKLQKHLFISKNSWYQPELWNRSPEPEPKFLNDGARA